jgi:hypothetical protein
VPTRLALLFPLLLTLLRAATLQAHGGFPEARQILLPPDRPQRIILTTNFGLIFSEDGGGSWLFSCEHEISAYAGSYLLAAQPSQRIFGLTTGAGLIHSDDQSCNWKMAGGSLSSVLPYAFAVDPADAQRVYAVGVPRADLRAGDGIYISGDGGLTFGEPVFRVAADSALLTILVAPNQTSTVFASMFSSAQNHPILLRSRDSGEHWEIAADLVDTLGENPFELLAIAASDPNRLYVRVLGPSAETLAISADGGLSFVPSISIPGKLSAFLELASGTILVGGTAGLAAVGYRSRDRGRTLEPWPEAPHIHALAERAGKLYVAADNFADGYVIAESDDEGAHLRPLASFEQVRAVKSCVSGVCAASCAYNALINLWPAAVCQAGSGSVDMDRGIDAGVMDLPDAEGGAELPRARASGARCAYSLRDGPATEVCAGLLLLGSVLLARRNARETSHGQMTTRLAPPSNVRGHPIPRGPRSEVKCGRRI